MSDPAAGGVDLPSPSLLKYKALIEEAYIDAIRTVTAVDDDFPSLDTVLSQLVSSGTAWSGDKAAVTTVLEILTYCRRRPRPWLVDVHDGAMLEGDIVAIPQLHQSDLIILDYHLAGEEGGEKAVLLLRRLATNGNFNLVVVYTKGTAGEIRDVFWEVVAGLTFAEWQGPKAERITQDSTALRAWEDSDSGITDRLKALVPRETYLRERALPCSTRASLFPTLQAIAKAAPIGAKVNVSFLFDWMLNSRHEEIIPSLATQDFGRIAFSFTESSNWIRTDQLFITVINKRKRPPEIEAALLDALVQSRPSPHQLLMAKMRAQMEEKGADAEAEVLSDAYLQAGWLQELITSEHPDRRRLLQTTVDRHWEALGQNLRGEVDQYAARLIEYVDERGGKEVLEDYIPGNIRANGKRILAHLNYYNCAKPEVERSHLTTGHIIALADGVSGGFTYWVCLSPACDLVPGQKQSSCNWFGRLGNFMPFNAVKLERADNVKALQRATSNSYVFFRVQGQIEAYTFYPSADISSNPAWEQMFAANQGRFIDGSTSVDICRIAGSADSLEISGPDRADIVAQLRYEYALNLLQRLGNTLSRVGLDFTAQTKQ